MRRRLCLETVCFPEEGPPAEPAPASRAPEPRPATSAAAPSDGRHSSRTSRRRRAASGDDHVGNETKLYIDGRWVDPVEPGRWITVVNPATEEEVAQVAAGSEADIDAAVQAAHRAFPAYSQTTPRGAPGAARGPARRLPAAPARDRGGHDHRGGHPQELLASRCRPTSVSGTWRPPSRCSRTTPSRRSGADHPHHPRAGGGLRAHLALELAHEPGDREGGARSGGGLHHGAQAQPVLAPLGPAGGRGRGRGRRARRGVQPGERPRLVPGRAPWPAIPWWTWSRSPAPPRWAPRWPGRRPAPSSGSPRSWAASRPTSSSTTSIWRRWSPAGCRAACATRGRAATRPRACWWRRPVYEEAVAIAARVAEGLKVGDPRDPDTFLGPVAGKKQYETVLGYIEVGLGGGRPPGGRGTGAARRARPRLLRQADRLRRRDTTPCASPGRRSSARCW